MLNELFIKISTALNNHNIPYMIIGGQAALLYREPRFTNDIDISLGIGIDDSEKLIDLCNETGLKILVSNPFDFITETMVLPVMDEVINCKIDFIFTSTQFEGVAISRANIVDMGGFKVAFCSLEDLIILKIFAGRTRDLDDVTNIIRKNPDYKREIVLSNLKELGNAIDSDLVTRFLHLVGK